MTRTLADVPTGATAVLTYGAHEVAGDRRFASFTPVTVTKRGYVLTDGTEGVRIEAHGMSIVTPAVTEIEA